MTEAQGRALLPELASNDPQRRLDAAIKLAVPGWTFAVHELSELAVRDSDKRVRRAAIYALGEIGDYAAYGLLQQIWQDAGEDVEVVTEALEACDKLDGLTSDGGGSTADFGNSNRDTPEF